MDLKEPKKELKKESGKDPRKEPGKEPRRRAFSGKFGKLAAVILLFSGGYLLLFLRAHYTLIPVLNNITLLVGILFILATAIGVIIFLALLPIADLRGRIFKVILVILLLGALCLGGFISFLYVAFEFRNNNSFHSGGEQYYCVEAGFPDIYYDIYKRTSWATMEKVVEYLEYVPEKITEENAPDLLKGRAPQSNQ